MFEADIKKYDGDFEKAIVRAQSKYMRGEKIKLMKSYPKRVIKKLLKTIGLR